MVLLNKTVLFDEHKTSIDLTSSKLDWPWLGLALSVVVALEQAAVLRAARGEAEGSEEAELDEV